MALRRAIILLTVTIGTSCLVAGTPPRFQSLTVGASFFLLGYIYAQLTRPKS